MKLLICLITGPAGAGKSTIADALANSNSFEKTVRIDVDYIRKMIKKGKLKPYPYTKEAQKQITLATKNVCDLVKNFVREDYNIFIDDVVVSKERLDLFFKEFKNYNFFVFVLMPNKKILEKRDKARGEKLAMNERALQLHDKFSKRLNEKRWYVIDTSSYTIEQTTQEILKVIFK